MAEKRTGEGQPVIIKKYANRRLYNTATSSYVTLDYLCQMVKDNIDFVVMDAKGNDITRSVLTQIIVEEEGKGENLLPLSFLRQLIAFYGDNMQRMLLPHYLEYSIDAFTKNQEKIQSYMQDTFGNMFPFDQLEQMGKKNIAMFEQAMRMFSPFTAPPPPNGDAATHDRNPPGAEAPSQGGPDIRTLQRQLDALQNQLDQMTNRKDEP